jgi:octaheme c-type cytochrome (tetrathionate reductase family)
MAGKIPFTGASSVDCFVCHDTTGSYRKALGGGGVPETGVDLVAVAGAVGRPSRANCGSCHFSSDGGTNIKHGDLEPTLTDPPDDFDVHMGRYDLLCQDCHSTDRHRIAGMSASAPAVEGRVTCVRCHGESPHGISGPKGRHLDNHFRAVACETCHIPFIAKSDPTRLFVDYSRAEVYGPVPAGEMGRPLYPESSGVEIWKNDAVPTYEWYDGTRYAYSIGDRISRARPVVLNQPLGEMNNPAAKIHPFKVHQAVQPYDPETRKLLVLDLWNGFWSHFDLGRAIADGMQAAGLEYSGSYEFVPTVQYSGIHHEIVPAGEALGCGDCHVAEAVDCQRCHSGASSSDTALYGAATYPEQPRLDFETLGYRRDPALVGGRFAGALGQGRPMR